MENKDSLFFQMYQIQNGKTFDSKDCILLMDSKVYKYPGEKCPFCNSILKDGHSKDCMMYEYPTISIWWFILPILLLIASGYIWLKFKINEYKKRKK